MTGWAFVASGLGIGFAPKAPGTFGSLLGLALGALLLHSGHLPLALGVLAITALGVYAIGTLDTANEDPGWVVIDEVAGQMTAMLALSHLSLRGIILSFVLFRFFDILKPGPVGWADSQHNEFGVMTDDIIAGLLAGVATLFLRLAVPL